MSSNLMNKSDWPTRGRRAVKWESRKGGRANSVSEMIVEAAIAPRRRAMAFVAPLGQYRRSSLARCSEKAVSTVVCICSRFQKRRQVSILQRQPEIQRQCEVDCYSPISVLPVSAVRKQRVDMTGWSEPLVDSCTNGNGGSGGRRGAYRRNFGGREGGDEAAGDPALFSIATVFAVARRQSTVDIRREEVDRLSNALETAFRSVRISHILLALNVAVFAFQTLCAPGMLMSGAKVNSAIAAGQYYRFLSPMFLHASTTHLLVNSFSLHSTGPSVESWFGRARFVTLYLISGISGNVLSYACSPTPAVGASGAIFGLVGASVVILGRHRRMLGPRARKGLQSLAFIVFMNFGIGLTPGSRVDNFGHLGGFLGGIAFSYLLGPRLVVRRGKMGRAVLRDEPIVNLAISELGERLRDLGLRKPHAGNNSPRH